MRKIEENDLLLRYIEIESLRKQGLNDNGLKIKYSKPIINFYGQVFKVNPPPKKSMKMKSGSCYGNAHSKREKGYEYVEGIIKNKNNGLEISHAWNVDKNGNHFDFTIIETDLFEYKGIIVPFSLRYEVSEQTGKVWYCVLPYLTFDV